jgi:hypothetical protein
MDRQPIDPSAPLPIPVSQPPRPSPVRSATLAAYQLSTKSRASSQPAGERFPVFGTSPGSGRDSPLSTSGKGGSYGVIGGARTPSRFSSGLPGPGTATRANSFSVAEGGLSQRVCLFGFKSSRVDFWESADYIACGIISKNALCSS